MDSIVTAFNINRPGIISFVGGGGKTTLMFRIAEELAGSDERILVTTTTKIFAPDSARYPHRILTTSRQELQEKAEVSYRRSKIIVAASRHCLESNKFIGFPPEVVDRLWRSGSFRWILVEADGSARKPIKAPAEHEPAMPLYTRYCFGLIGLSALGKPLNEEHVHRVARFQDITGMTLGEDIDLSALAALIAHKSGLFKKCPAAGKTIAFLNQADRLSALGAGKSIAEQLCQRLSDLPDIVAVGRANSPDRVIQACCQPLQHISLKRSNLLSPEF